MTFSPLWGVIAWPSLHLLHVFKTDFENSTTKWCSKFFFLVPKSFSMKWNPFGSFHIYHRLTRNGQLWYEERVEAFPFSPNIKISSGGWLFQNGTRTLRQWQACNWLHDSVAILTTICMTTVRYYVVYTSHSPTCTWTFVSAFPSIFFHA